MNLIWCSSSISTWKDRGGIKVVQGYTKSLNKRGKHFNKVHQARISNYAIMSDTKLFYCIANLISVINLNSAR
jgi:hypothetical protein